MTSPHEVRSCAFRVAGAVTRTGPLSWAQRYMWRAVNLPGNDRNMDHLFSVRVSTAMSVDVATACLGQLIERHPALRTCVEADADGQVSQRVLGSGTIPVHVWHAARPLGRAEILAGLPFIDGSPPLRALIVAVDGQVRSVAMRLSHIVTDEWGLQLIQADLASLVSAPGAAARRPAALMDMVDVAGYEASEQGQFVNTRALEYAADQLKSAPQTMFPHPPLTEEKPRYWNVELRSKAMLAALNRLRSEQRLLLSVPVAGAFAAVMAARASLPTALIYVMSNNRTASCRDFSGPLLQEAPLSIPVAGWGCAGLVQSLRIPLLEAFQNASCDPIALEKRVAEIEWERGVCIDKLARTATVNIHHQAHETLDRPASAPYSRDQLKAMARSSEFARIPRSDVDNLAFYLDVFIGASCLVLTARVDTRLVSLAESEAILSAMEDILCELTEGDIPADDIPHRYQGIGRHFGGVTAIADGCRISARDCADVLTAHPGVAAAHVHIGEEADPVVTARIQQAPPDSAPDLDLAELHRFVVAALPRYPLAIAPHIYRVYASRPGRLDDLTSWDDRPLVTTGTGRHR